MNLSRLNYIRFNVYYQYIIDNNILFFFNLAMYVYNILSNNCLIKINEL